MSESRKDQISRLRLMAKGDAQWDLSTNDRAAIRAALEIVEVAECVRVTLEPQQNSVIPNVQEIRNCVTALRRSLP